MEIGHAVRRQWMVLIEAADDQTEARMDAAAFRRMMTSWGGPPPTGLYSPSRYALQVSVKASDPQSALVAAVGHWAAARRRAGVPDWPLVRAEIVTPDEFERDLLSADPGAADPDTATAAPASPCDPAGEDLLRRALHDPVTGLANREQFLGQVGAAVAAGLPIGPRQAVMVVEVAEAGVDRSALGEEVLVEVAGRLKDAVRRADVVARVSPAQFALLVTVRPGEDLDLVARRVVENVRSPILDEGPTVSVTASVGVAATASGTDADQLLLMAELALSEARDAGGDCHRQFTTR